MPIADAAAATAVDSAASHDEPPSRLFGDWLAACDNAGDCSAYGFGADDAAATLIVSRPRGASSNVALVLQPDRPVRSMLVRLQPVRRGAAVSVRLQPAPPGHSLGDTLRGALTAGEVAVLMPELQQGGRLLLQHPGGTGTIRLAGAGPAFDWITERQRRPPAALPVIRAPAAPPAGDETGDGPATRMPDRVAVLAAVRACRRDNEDDPGSMAEAWPIAAAVTLWQVPCGSGNFDHLSLFVLTRRAPGRLLAEPVMLAAPRQVPPHPIGMLANAELDQGGREITATEPSRGLGDCGDVRRYRWDGQRYRLVLARLMIACRGLAPDDWPIIYRTLDAAR